MAKQLRDILKQASDTIKGVRPSTTSALSLGKDPGVDYDPKAGDEREFVAAHSVQKWDDPAGNPNFSKDIKHVLDRAGEDKHGHKNDEAKKKSVLPVKEEVDLKKAKGMQCNESPAGVACPVHGLKECMNETAKTTLKEKGVNEALGSMANIKKASMKGYQDSRKGQPPLTASDARTLGKVSDMMKKEKAIQAAKKVQKEETAEKTTLAQYKKKIHPQSDFEKKTFQEENKLYHVSWGPGAEHQVVAKHGDEAVSKAKSAILKKVPKLADEKYAATWKKSPRVTNLTHERKVQKEEVALDEAVTVKKTTHPWGKMVTVHHGSSHSFPLHPEHQEKIAKLKDGEHTSFTDETNTKVKAHREGDTIHLSQKGVNKTTPVARHHFAEETQIDEVITKKTSAGEVISDFIHSKNPKFAGKSKEKRKQMALAAYYAKQRNEEVEEVEEIDEMGIRDSGLNPNKYKDNPKRYAPTFPKAYKAPGTPSKAEVRSEIEKLTKNAVVKKLPAGKAKGLKEDLAVPLLGSNEDDESAEMAKAQLKALANKAMHLVMQMPDSMILEPWVQSKITLAKDYVNTVHDYMVYGDHDKDKKEPTSDKSVVADQMDTPMTFPNMSVDVNTGQNV